MYREMEKIHRREEAGGWRASIMKLLLKAEIIPDDPILTFFLQDPRFEIIDEGSRRYIIGLANFDQTAILFEYNAYPEEEYFDLCLNEILPGLLFHEIYKATEDLCARVIEDPSLLGEIVNNFMGMVELTEMEK